MPGIEISQLPPKLTIDPTDLFPIAILPYQVPGSNRHITGAQLLALRPTYFESCLQGNTNLLGGTSVLPGQNLILTEGEYILDWGSSVTNGVQLGSNTFWIGYNTNSLLVNYDVTDQRVSCTTRRIATNDPVDTIPFFTKGRIIIPAGQTWIIKPTFDNVTSPIVTIGAENLLTALKIA